MKKEPLEKVQVGATKKQIEVGSQDKNNYTPKKESQDNPKPSETII